MPSPRITASEVSYTSCSRRLPLPLPCSIKSVSAMLCFREDGREDVADCATPGMAPGSFGLGTSTSGGCLEQQTPIVALFGASQPTDKRSARDTMLEAHGAPRCFARLEVWGDKTPPSLTSLAAPARTSFPPAPCRKARPQHSLRADLAAACGAQARWQRLKRSARFPFVGRSWRHVAIGHGGRDRLQRMHEPSPISAAKPGCRGGIHPTHPPHHARPAPPTHPPARPSLSTHGKRLGASMALSAA